MHGQVFVMYKANCIANSCGGVIKRLQVQYPAGNGMPVMLVTNVHPDVIKAKRPRV